MEISLDTVREAALLLHEKNLVEISVEATAQGGPTQAFTLRRSTHAPHSSSGSAARDEGGSAGSGAQVYQMPESIDEAPDAPVKPLLVCAAAVGLFRNPSRVVGAGDEVVAGQVIGIVESLKVPNEVRVPQAGRIVELLVEEGQGVEYGQPVATLQVVG